jgi:hypothetical protein
MVDITPGDSGANKGFWRKQLRDRYGKFVEMGGEVMFDIELPGVYGKAQALGKFIGNVEPGLARIEVLDNSRIPKGVYLVKSEDITAIEAILPDDYVKEKLEEVNAPTAEPAPELKTEISGDEAKKEIFRYVARVLKEDGRFPVARNSLTSARGKNSDMARGAKLAYKKVFDAEPVLQEKYKTAENMWEAVLNYATDEKTQSPNKLSEIPQDMKELNIAYAKHVLGLDPNGLITFYRNAVNGKNEEEESAVGYVSLDRDMAYDYNSKKKNEQANGRYEVYAKPDEVYGMIGYSGIEDEFAVTVGRELAYTPGRIKRVGDLAPIYPDEPWLFEYSDQEFPRGTGATPFRYFTLMSHFNFHPVEPLGDTLQDFLDKYNLSATDIKTKFDELHGQGAYDKYKASGNNVNFNKLKNLFIDVGDGKVALNVPSLMKLEKWSSNPDVDYKNDLLDNHLKALSTLQELTGQPFFTHRTRDYTPPVEEPAPTPTPVVEEQPEISSKFGRSIFAEEEDRTKSEKLKNVKSILSDEKYKQLVSKSLEELEKGPSISPSTLPVGWEVSNPEEAFLGYYGVDLNEVKEFLSKSSDADNLLDSISSKLDTFLNTKLFDQYEKYKNDSLDEINSLKVDGYKFENGTSVFMNHTQYKDRTTNEYSESFTTTNEATLTRILEQYKELNNEYPLNQPIKISLSDQNNDNFKFNSEEGHAHDHGEASEFEKTEFVASGYAIGVDDLKINFSKEHMSITTSREEAIQRIKDRYKQQMAEGMDEEQFLAELENIIGFSPEFLESEKIYDIEHVFAHEYGHLLENAFIKLENTGGDQSDEAKLINEIYSEGTAVPSDYGTINSAEFFAEHFSHRFFKGSQAKGLKGERSDEITKLIERFKRID